MKLKKKYRKKALFVGILLALLFFIPKAFAEDIVPVTPGTGTLQQQINSAVEGATLQLSEGTYKGDITIDKNITIQGVSNQSIIDGKIIIKSEDHQGNLNVTLKNYRIPPSSLSSSDLAIFNTYKYIDVQSPTNLTLSNVIINPVISRPPVGYRAGGPIALNIAETADHSTIEVQDHTELTCHYDGIHIFASQVTLNVTDSSVSGALALNLENGTDNKVTFRNSSLVGRSLLSRNDEAVAINKQTNLTLDFINSKLEGVDASSNVASSMISFDGVSGDNKNVKVNLKEGTTISDKTKDAGSVLFHFGQSNTLDNSNSIYLDSTVTLTDGEEINFKDNIARKYNTSEGYSVVGIYDADGGMTVEAYTKNVTIPEAKLPQNNKPGYKLKGYTYRTAGQSDLVFTPDVTQITENMDISANYVRVYQVKIGTEEDAHEVEENTTFAQFKQMEGIEEKLNALKDARFSRFVDEEGNTIDDAYQFTKDVTIQVKKNIEVKIEGSPEQTFTLEEGKSLQDLSPEEKTRLENLVKKEEKDFDHYEKEGETITNQTPLDNDVTLTPKYKVKVTIGEDQFTLNENETLQNLTAEQQQTLNTHKNAAKKHFDHFEDDAGTTIEESTPITKHTTLIPKFKVQIQVGNDTLELDEGQTLNDLSVEDQGKLNLHKVDGNKTFRYWTVDGEKIDDTSKTFEEDATLVPYFVYVITIDDTTYDLEAGKKLKDSKEIMAALENLKQKESHKEFSRYVEKGTKTTVSEDQEITGPLSIDVIYKVKVTIDGTEFTLEQGQKLSDLSEQDKNKLEGMKTKDGKTFSRFVQGEGTFDESTPIDDDITLTIKQNVTIHIGNQDYLLEEGKTLQEDGTISQALEDLKQKGNGKEFSRYIDKANHESTVTLSEPVSKNMDIDILFKVKVTIDGTEFTLEQGQKLSDLEEQDQQKLESMKTKDGKTFSRFVQGDSTFDETTSIEDDITLTIKQNAKVTIDKDYYVEEGAALSTSQEVMAALQKLKDNKKKVWKEFVDESMSQVQESTPARHGMVITAHYRIRVTIDGVDYYIEDQQSLESLDEAAKQALKAMEELTNKQFIEYVDGNGRKVTLDEVPTENLVIKGKYEITITIGDEEFTLEEGQSLKDLSKADWEKLDDLIAPDEGEEIKGYRNIDTDEIIQEDTALHENATLEPVYQKIAVPQQPANNPNTFDMIKMYIGTAFIAIAGLLVTLRWLRPKKRRKTF